MKISKFITIALALASMAVSCSIKESIPASKPFISIEEDTIKVAKAGDMKTIAVASNCDWITESDQPWVKIFPTAGNESTKAMSLQILENETSEVRSATITVKGAAASETLVIVQNNIAKQAGDIETADEFEQFLKNASTAVETDVFTLLNDIDMEGRTIAPAISFAGHFEGNNHKVYNYKAVSAQSTAGLFLSVEGEINDVILGSKDGKTWDGVSEVGFDNSVEATSHIGGVAAQLVGNMTNVKNFAKVVTPLGTTALAGIGGLVGMTESASHITDCENNAAIAASGKYGAELYIAGVVAYVNNAAAVISNCVNNSDIDVTVHIDKASMFAGVVGRANLGAVIEKCTNNGNISYTQQNADQNGNYIMIAGVAGALYTGSVCQNCINNGLVSSNNQQVSRIGGIVGTLNSNGLVEGNVNKGEVFIRQAAPNANWQSAGGIVGFQEKQNSNLVRNNTNEGNVSVEVEITTTHANQINAGGIIGLATLGMESSYNVNKGTISCVNKGATSAHVGGIAGWLKGAGTMSTSDENQGAVIGTSADCAGALVGSNDTSVKDGVVGGSVNGTAVTASNISALACGSSSVGSVSGLKTGSGEVASELGVDKKEINVAAEDLTASFNVTSNTAWTVTTSASWISDYTKSGSNDGTVTITFPANTSTTDARTATFTVSADKVDPITVTLTQGKVLDANPYCIPNAEELALFVQESYKETPDYSRWMKGGVISVTSDIDASAITALPIDKLPADVIFDGNNKTIKLALAKDCDKLALFNTVSGTVRNVVVEGSVETQYTGTGEFLISGIVVDLKGGTLDNCINKADLTCSSNSSTYSYIGGVVARVQNEGSVVKNCKNAGKLTVEKNAAMYVGGVVGNVIASANLQFVLSNCTSSGAIEINHTGNNWEYIGGVIGKVGKNGWVDGFTLKIENCISSSDITVKKGPKARSGGVFGSCGLLNYEVINCEYSGHYVVEDYSAVDRIFAGVGPGFSEAAATGTVSGCTFSGSIVAEQAGGNYYFAGIYGNNGAGTVVIDGCKTTAQSKVSALSPKSVGMIAARPNAAGFTVKNCKVGGTVNKGDGDIAITAETLEDWMLKGSATSVAVTLEGNAALQ